MKDSKELIKLILKWRDNPDEIGLLEEIVGMAEILEVELAMVDKK